MSGPIVGKRLKDINVREGRLRWPVELDTDLTGQELLRVDRRGKYLLFHFRSGALILHLGMSGRLRIVNISTPLIKHDHIDFVFEHDLILRFNDSRRFGSVHFSSNPECHWLLRRLGPEPLEDAYNADYMFDKSRQVRQAIKPFVMNSRVVVGIGNIYANEALFRSGIRPRIAAGRVSRNRYKLLVRESKIILREAIEVGGTTLRDYFGSNGERGYFAQSLDVYGREGKLCRICSTGLKSIRLGQRATVYCPRCQR